MISATTLQLYHNGFIQVSGFRGAELEFSVFKV